MCLLIPSFTSLKVSSASALLPKRTNARATRSSPIETPSMTPICLLGSCSSKSGAPSLRRSVRIESGEWSKTSIPHPRSTGNSELKATFTVRSSSFKRLRSIAKVLVSVLPDQPLFSSSSEYDFSSSSPSSSSSSSSSESSESSADSSTASSSSSDSSTTSSVDSSTTSSDSPASTDSSSVDSNSSSSIAFSSSSSFIIKVPLGNYHNNCSSLPYPPLSSQQSLLLLAHQIHPWLDSLGLALLDRLALSALG